MKGDEPGIIDTVQRFYEPWAGGECLEAALKRPPFDKSDLIAFYSACNEVAQHV